MQMKRKIFILSFVLVALIAVTALTGCNGNGGGSTLSPAPTESPAPTPPVVGEAEIGEGETVFRFEVTDDTGLSIGWFIRTDEETIGAALLEVGLIAGTVGEWGLMVEEVNGLRAVYADGFWWQFLVDGEMSTTGVDTTDIEPGKTYAFVHTPA